MAIWEVEGFPECCCCCCCCPCWVLVQLLKLGCQQWRRWRQRWGLRNEDIEFLKMELRSILAALRLVEMVPPEMLPAHLKYWAARSREASYNIQDILDTFLVLVVEAHPDTSNGLLLRKMARSSLRHITWRKFADAIIDVKIMVHEIAEERGRRHTHGFLAADAIRLQEIAERLPRYRADTNPAATIVDPRLLDLIIDERRLVGSDGAVEEVIGRLSMDTDDTSTHQLKTVCIVGGLGRTILTRALYQKLQTQFDCSAFVSFQPNIIKVLRIILQQLDNGEHRNETTGTWDVQRLVDQLRQLLQNKRYIIAVDDIWYSESWETIISAMVDNNLGSRIITSTGMSEVAEEIGGSYELRPFCNDDSFYTFRKILLHSYYQLPSHLRPCFLYISMFPEGSDFRRDRLVWRWIAEGFIEGKEGCSLFQIGQKYFDELLNRSLIIEVDKEISDGMTKYCHVHYMVLDLASSLACDENFVTKLVYEEVEDNFIPKDVRRLSIQNSLLGRRAHTLEVGQHVRSVGVFGTGINLMPPLSRFNIILRVLDLEGCDLGGRYYNIQHLGKLLNLRYLGLRGTNVSQKLPKDIGNLRFLQILDLKGTWIRELPSTVALLHNLLCLYAEPDTRIPKGMGNLTSLEELSKVTVSESPSLMKELNSLVQLRVLDIVLKQGMSESSEKDLLESLCNLHKLQALGIYGHHSGLDFMTKEGWVPPPGLCRFIVVHCWFWFSVLPTWISNAESLSELQIGVRELWREGLQSLGKLPELRFLSLSVEHMGERLAVDADGFPNLQQLRVSAETCLVFRQGAMPKVEVLEFVLDVDKADGDFNWGLANLCCLLKVTVKLCIGNSVSANKEAEAALRHEVSTHPNHPKLEVTMVTSPNKQIELVDEGAANVASSSEIQEERYAI